MATNSEMLRATNNEDLIPSFEIKDAAMAARRLDDIIRVYSDHPLMTEQLREIRRFIEREM